MHIVDARYVTFQYINIDGNEYDGEGIIIGAGAMGEYSEGVDQNDEHDITVQYDLTDLGRVLGSTGILARAHFTDVYNININHNIIDGTTGTGIGFYPQRTTYGGTLKKVYNSYIGYNNISGFNKVGSGAGILLKETNENIIIEYNKVRTGDGGGTDGGMGINLDRQEPTDGNYCPTNITIRYNDVEVSLDVAFYISIAAAEQCAMSAKIYYNRFYCTKTDKPAAWINRGTGTFTGSSFLFYNNTMIATANNTATFREAGAVNGITTLINNVIVCTGKGGNGDDMAMESANTLAAHSNNLYLRTLNTTYDYVAVASTYYDPTETVTWEATAKVTNPFTYSSSDFHLTGGSPAINTGVLVTTIPQFDIQGNDIIGLPDMGAYESSAPLTGFNNIVQIKRTIGWDGATGTDHVWTGDANHTAQNLDLGAIIPAKSRVIAIEIVCTEALVGCADMTFAVGNASGGAQWIAALSCDELNEVVGIIDASLVDGIIMNWASATNVWIGGDPSDNTWADMTAGKWTVYITYINYTQI